PQEKQGTLSSITIEKKTPESVPIPDTTPSPISDDPGITAYHQGMVEFGILAKWHGVAGSIGRMAVQVARNTG
ncbi:MAG: hypothetical protein GY862_15985, partial [Gammaproteobacteria bacterium]|nr:hypothetical protein [Gammaproteobacteria bacterium]